MKISTSGCDICRELFWNQEIQAKRVIIRRCLILTSGYAPMDGGETPERRPISSVPRFLRLWFKVNFDLKPGLDLGGRVGQAC